jgi:hypothetical protein
LLFVKFAESQGRHADVEEAVCAALPLVVETTDDLERYTSSFGTARRAHAACFEKAIRDLTQPLDRVECWPEAASTSSQG